MIVAFRSYIDWWCNSTDFSRNSTKCYSNEEENDDAEGVDDDEEMSFSEFLDGLVAVAAYKFPDPFTPLSARINTFLLQLFAALRKHWSRKRGAARVDMMLNALQKKMRWRLKMMVVLFEGQLNQSHWSHHDEWWYDTAWCCVWIGAEDTAFRSWNFIGDVHKLKTRLRLFPTILKQICLKLRWIRPKICRPECTENWEPDELRKWRSGLIGLSRHLVLNKYFSIARKDAFVASFFIVLILPVFKWNKEMMLWDL